MARTFKPYLPFNVPMYLLIPTDTYVKGSIKKVYSDPSQSTEGIPLFYGSFRTFGGTESITNDVYSVVDTGVIDTWYRPDIKANCRIYLPYTGETWDIVNNPENIEMRNQYLQFKVKRIGGGA